MKTIRFERQGSIGHIVLANPPTGLSPPSLLKRGGERRKVHGRDGGGIVKR
jgi:hypothetical protein